MNKALNIALGTLVAVGISAPVVADNWLDQLALKGAATYTEPSNSGLNFGALNISPNTWRPFFVDPKHEFDFFGGVEFRTSKTGETRLIIEYDHYNASKQRNASGLQALGKQAAAGTSASGDVKHEDYSMKFGARHTLHFGPFFDFILGGFIEYAKVERTFKEAFTTAAGSTTASRETEDEMEGWGPGVDALGRAFPFGNDNHNWSLFATGGFSLLYAEHEYHSKGFIFPLVGGSSTFDPSFDPEESESIVVKIETGLGIEYARLLTSDMANLTLGARLGLRHINYINALRSGNFSYDGISYSSAGGAADTTHRDYGRMGPFLEFRLGGAHS